jgi:hypothetical protein
MAAAGSRIIVTHDASTLIQTARFLKKSISRARDGHKGGVTPAAASSPGGTPTGRPLAPFASTSSSSASSASAPPRPPFNSTAAATAASGAISGALSTSSGATVSAPPAPGSAPAPAAPAGGRGPGLVLRSGSSGSGGTRGLGVEGAVTSAVALKPSELAKLRDKVIIVTGALRPERFADSDAPLNVGAAVCAVGLLPPGVYVCMQGQVFDPNGVDRVVTNGCFVSKGVVGQSDSDSD